MRAIEEKPAVGWGLHPLITSTPAVGHSLWHMAHSLWGQIVNGLVEKHLFLFRHLGGLFTLHYETAFSYRKKPRKKRQKEKERKEKNIKKEQMVSL